MYSYSLRNQTKGPLLHTGPYSHLDGVDGRGVTVSLGYNISKVHGFSVLAPQTIRYDMYKFSYTSRPNNIIYWDTGLALEKRLVGVLYLGSGFTVFNVGRELDWNDGVRNYTLNLQFISSDIILKAKVHRRFIIEAKFAIVSRGFPGNLKANANLLGGSFFYRFRLPPACREHHAK